QYISEIDAAADAIGRNLAGLVQDGSYIQMGIGKIPAAIAKYLRDHRKLKIHSGMVTDFVRDLHEGGALDETHDHVATFAAVSQDLYEWLPTAPWIRIIGVEEIFHTPTLARLNPFVAVNAALEV